MGDDLTRLASSPKGRLYRKKWNLSLPRFCASMIAVLVDAVIARYKNGVT